MVQKAIYGAALGAPIPYLHSDWTFWDTDSALFPDQSSAKLPAFTKQ